MTIERPMFPPRAESVDLFSHQPGIGQPKSQILASDSPKPVDRPSAEVVSFPAKSKRRSRQQLENQSSLEDREHASSLLKEAVTFTACVAAYDGAWKAERTGDGLFAGSDGIVGGRFWDGAEKSLARLTRHIRKVDKSTVLTVELRSLAAVAGFILDRERKNGDEEVSLQRHHVDFLIAFAALADGALGERYEHEFAEG